MEEFNKLLSHLNETQKMAVLECDNPLLIIACAGAGKTSVIIHKIAYLINQKNMRPWEILAVTFTNKAAREMQERLTKMHGDKTENYYTQGMWMGTFHSICSRILRMHGELLGYRKDFVIVNEDDQIKIIKDLSKSIGVDPKKVVPKAILNVINSWKDKALRPYELSSNDFKDPKDYVIKIAANIYNLYQDRLKASNSMDFGDLINNVIFLFKDHKNILEQYQDKFKYILVDEYQDTNISQDMLIRMLSEKNKKICCVGDDDQSIYGWRGASVQNIINFPKNFENTKIVKLEKNYRSTKNILAAAYEVISRNKNRFDKVINCDNSDGNKIHVLKASDEDEEAEMISSTIRYLMKAKNLSYKNYAILVRSSFQTRAFEESFLRYAIKYKVVGSQKFYDRLEIRDAIAYIRVVYNHDDSLAFERIINTPRRGIGDGTIEQIVNFSAVNNMSLFKAADIMLKEKMFSAKIAKNLADLIDKIKLWNTMLSNTSCEILLEKILTDSGYIAMWSDSKKEEDKARVENLKELIASMSGFKDMGSFLEHISLVTSEDDDENADKEFVSIMTIHGAKGLEFPVVFLPGWEENIFPTSRANASVDRSQLEEERRLAYVAITRAKRLLFISHATRRAVFGSYQFQQPSEFLIDIPKNLCINSTRTSLLGNVSEVELI